MRLQIPHDFNLNHGTRSARAPRRPTDGVRREPPRPADGLAAPSGHRPRKLRSPRGALTRPRPRDRNNDRVGRRLLERAPHHPPHPRRFDRHVPAAERDATTTHANRERTHR